MKTKYGSTFLGLDIGFKMRKNAESRIKVLKVLAKLMKKSANIYPLVKVII